MGRVGILITASLATYETLNAENKPKEAIRQGMQIGGSAAGGWLAGLAGSVVADSLDKEIEEFTTWKIN